MSMSLEFEPHSWYMGFAIEDNRADWPSDEAWRGYTDDGNTYRIDELEAASLSDLKWRIRQYHLKRRNGYGERYAKRRIAYIRGELENERASLGELAELSNLASYIDPSDVQMLEAAGVPESAR